MSSRRDVSFASEGGVCTGWLYEGEGESEGRIPCVVMAHGFGALKEGRLDAFAERFAAQGWQVLVFDYRHFGTSTGEPRGLLNTRRQHEDWQAAIAHARSLPGVDPDRVAIWGSSNSGGHVLWAGARDQRLVAVVSQVPHTDGPATMREMGARGAARLTVAGLRDAIASLFGREYRMGIVGPPGSVAAMTTPDAEPGYTAMYPPDFEWDNSIPARIALTYGLYSPGRDAARIQCPLLMVVGDNDAVTPPKPARAAAARAPRGELVTHPCGHFDVYVGDLFETVVAEEIEFLGRHLA